MTKDATTWGIDIGGANIKICRPNGTCDAVAFPMWIDPTKLGGTLAAHFLKARRVSEDHPKNSPRDTTDSAIHSLASRSGLDHESTLAITMTGELADCFESRSEGVRTILDQVTSVVPESRCRVYTVLGSWLDVPGAKNSPWSVAASNWHALANWILHQRDGSSQPWNTVIDIGSTTVDIIPIRNGEIGTNAQTDRQRLELGQLVYTGMERTPIHAIVRSLRVQDRRCPLMAERFATIFDANLILEAVDDEPENHDTADGRPRTRQYALSRLARMVGEDRETLPETELVSMAQQIVSAQARQVRRALWQNLNSSGTLAQCPKSSRILVSGHGRAMIERLRQHPSMRNIAFDYLDDFLDPATARCAPAAAVAWLWQNRNAL